MSKAYWKPEQPPPLTEMRSAAPGLAGREPSVSRRAALALIDRGGVASAAAAVSLIGPSRGSKTIGDAVAIT